MEQPLAPEVVNQLPVVPSSPETKTVEISNAYRDSYAATKLLERKNANQPLKMAFFDIDSTVTGNANATSEIRKHLEESGYVVCFITSRTEEMIMTDTKRSESPTLNRPDPHLGVDEFGKRFQADPEVVESNGLLNADIIAGTTGSSGPMVKQIDGSYVRDPQFEVKAKAESDVWRKGAKQLIDFVNKCEPLCQIAPIDDANNYLVNETDIFPPDFRFQLDFPSLEAKQKFQDKVTEFKLTNKLGLLSQGLDVSAVENIFNIKITDDSKPAESKFTTYLTPIRGYKARAEEEIVSNICKQVGVNRSDLELLIAGDSFPDLGMGFYGGVGTQATFLLAGGSRLSEDLIKPVSADKNVSFAGEGLNAIRNRLKPVEGKLGHYTFRQPSISENESSSQSIKTRNIVILDQVFPGQKSADSILSFLQTQK